MQRGLLQNAGGRRAGAAGARSTPSPARRRLQHMLCGDGGALSTGRFVCICASGGAFFPAARDLLRCVLKSENLKRLERANNAISLSHLYEITHAQQASSSAGPKKTLKLVVSCPSFSKWMGSTGGRR